MAALRNEFNYRNRYWVNYRGSQIFSVTTLGLTGIGGGRCRTPRHQTIECAPPNHHTAATKYAMSATKPSQRMCS